MRFLTASLLAALAATANAQLPALGTSILTPVSSSQAAIVTPNITAAAQTSTTTTGTTSSTAQNQIDVNSLFINTQDICIYQNMKQKEKQWQAQEFEFDVSFLTGGYSGVNNASAINTDGTSSVNGTSTAAGTTGLSGTTAMLTPIGNGFWTFANTAHQAPECPDSLAVEESPDSYVPSFMQTFWTNWQNEFKVNEEIAEIISVNNVHIFNFNIQPLLEIDIQFQVQPQWQTGANGFVLAPEYGLAGTQSDINSNTTNTAGTTNTGTTQQNNQYNQQQNNQYNNQQQQQYSNQWPQQNDNQWPFANSQQQTTNAFSEFIAHSGNNIIVNTLSINKQRKYLTQIAKQKQEEWQAEENKISLDFSSGYSDTQATTSSANTATPLTTGTTDSTGSTSTGTGYTTGTTTDTCTECEQPVSQQYTTEQEVVATNSFAQFQFNFNNIVVRNKNVQIAVIVAAQVQLEAEAQLQANGALIL